MKRGLLGLLGTVIIAAVQIPLSAATSISEDVPVPGGTAGLARALGIDPVPDRGRFIAELTRLAYDVEGRNPTAALFLQAVRQAFLKGQRPTINMAGGTPELVPVPLAADAWGNAIFHRRVTPEDLIMSIIADRQATLLCHGLASLDDETLQFFAEHTSLLSRLHERTAPAFAAFASNLHVRGNRVVPPGGTEAAPLWEAVVGEKVTRPERFVLALFEVNEGRLAYLYDIAGSLDPARRAFLLGSWLSDPQARLDRFKELATTGVNAFKDSHLRTIPHGRTPWDLAMTFMRLEVTETGAPAPPASRALWTRAFASTDLPDETAAARGFDDAPIDAAWVATIIGDSDVRQRIERLDQIGFAQRSFGRVTAADANAMLVALRALPHSRMLILGLERMGVRSPSVYAAAARHANRLAAFDGIRGFVAQAQFQGALALVARLVSVRTIDTPQVETLIARLVAKPLNEEGRYAGAIARWVQDDLRAVIRDSGDGVDDADGVDFESALIAALSGRASGAPSHVPVIWEGQQYRLDFAFAERRRLLRVREKQAGLRLDVPLEIAGIARSLADGNGSLDILATIARLTKLLPDLPRHGGTEVGGAGAPVALSGALDGQEVARKAIDELMRMERRKDAKRESRHAVPLTELADELLGQVLLSFAYAMHVGDPEGAVLLAGDVSYRHDFGFAIKDTAMRVRASWSVPRQEIAPNVPWHLSGSLLGLDIGLASMALRRMNFDHLTGAPKLTSNERDAFAVSVALLNPYDLRDEDRDRIVEGIGRGRTRVLALATDAGAFDALADDIGIGGARRRALRWTLTHEPERLVTMFSLTEVLSLGTPAVSGGDPLTVGFGSALDSWGMNALTTTGCFCLRLAPPGQWWLVVGRPQLGVVASAMADLNLHVAASLKELQMPAALAKAVLAAAMQDFIDEVRPTDAGDWLTLSRAARAATREQIEDYLSAATADGPLVPDNTRPTPQQ